MTPEAQRIAIAEACGWKGFHFRSERHLFATAPHQTPNGGPIGVPDYLNDLNAMHEAENTLTEREWFIYGDKLHEVLNADASVRGKRDAYRMHASSHHRAEAFLKVKGKWEDDK